MATLYTQHFVQFFDDDGAPLAGGKLYAYEAGTTTPKDTYTNAGGGTPNANPVVLDAAGRATVFLSGSYKFKLTDSADVEIETTDNVTSFLSSAGTGVGDITSDFTDTAIALGDSVVFSDLSDSGTTKRDTVQGIIDLIPAITAPTRQYLTSGTGATYTTPAGCVAILVEMVGGGGGGGATATNSGTAGGTTTFNSVNAVGGAGGEAGGASGGEGGYATTPGTGSATFRVIGSAGACASYGTGSEGGVGGGTQFGGAGRAGVLGSLAGQNAQANSGSGGGGAAGNGASNFGGGGGQAGELVHLYIASPSATYTYTVGTGGSGGSAGTNAGGNGGTGMIIVQEFYQ